MKKGPDFIQEMEMGRAPPKELIEKNLKYNVDDFRTDRNLEEIIKKS